MMAIDIEMLWDYSNPGLSEERFRSAMQNSTHEDQLILQTQIARTFGLRGDFDQARSILDKIAKDLPVASAETQARYYLEMGRSFCSGSHDLASQTDDAREKARAAFMRAFEIAKNEDLNALAIDALHMMTFVDTDPIHQVDWNQKAIELMQSSTQPDAKKWAGSLHNNMGYALHTAGKYEEALEEFQLALIARIKQGNQLNIRIAHWMVAWTLHALGRLEEAVTIQRRLEQEWDADGEPDPYVFEELEKLYRELGKSQQADHYANRLRSIQQSTQEN